MRTITLALTNFNRFSLLIESFRRVIDDERVSEIIISDDASEMELYKDVVDYFKTESKVKIHRNATNQGVYRNKFHSVVHATNEWVVIFDSDNIIGKDYINRLYEIEKWDEQTEYCPARALTEFDYSQISKDPITKENVNTLWKKKQFDAMMNTFNSFFNRAEYLRVWTDDFEPISSDSIYFNYKWLAAGNKIQIVDGLQYQHRIHDGSHYVQNCAKSMTIHQDIENKIRQLK